MKKLVLETKRVFSFPRGRSAYQNAIPLPHRAF